MKDVDFIPREIILYFHKKLIQRYGGSLGIRDEQLLDSALKQPTATFDGSYLHDSILKMAAAYGFHLCKNHPFVDGNKRIALVAMDVFLQRNGYELTASEKKVYRVMMGLSVGEISKEELVDWLQENTTKLSGE